MTNLPATTAGREQYPVLFGGVNMAEVVQENFGESGINATDLDIITIPAGGGTTWEVPTLEGTEAARAIEGIIVAWQSPRAYWAQGLDESEGGTPPDCASEDSVVGVGAYGPGSEGNPSGECAVCPQNAWGSDPKGGKSKACKEMRRLFVLLPNSVLPVVVSLPPTSIQPLRKYFLRLASSGVPYYGVVTRLTLEKVNSGGFTWSVVTPTLGRKLEPDEVTAARAFGEALKGGMHAAQSE